LRAQNNRCCCSAYEKSIHDLLIISQVIYDALH